MEFSLVRCKDFRFDFPPRAMTGGAALLSSRISKTFTLSFTYLLGVGGHQHHVRGSPFARLAIICISGLLSITQQLRLNGCPDASCASIDFVHNSTVLEFRDAFR